MRWNSLLFVDRTMLLEEPYELFNNLLPSLIDQNLGG